MRTIIVEDRSWKADQPSTTNLGADRREHADPVTAALVTYGYARV